MQCSGSVLVRDWGVMYAIGAHGLPRPGVDTVRFAYSAYEVAVSRGDPSPVSSYYCMRVHIEVPAYALPILSQIKTLAIVKVL